MRLRSRSNLARPYACRFSSFSRLIWPSTGPLLHGWDRAARTAARSPVIPVTKPCNAVVRAAVSQASNAAVSRSRRMRPNSLITAVAARISGARAVSISTNCRSAPVSSSAGVRGEQACRASARGHAPGRQWQLSVCTGGIKAAAPDGPPPDDVVSALEPLIVQLAPQLGTVVAPLGPASLHIPKMPIECTRSQSAAIYRRLAGAQPAAHGVTRHAQAPRNTADRHARTVQPSHLFIACLPLLAPLRPLPGALRGRLLLACRRHRHDSRRQAEPGGSAQRAGVPVEHAAQRLGGIHHQVPAVGDLRCLRRTHADAFRVSARAVAADDSNILAVLLQPGGQCLARSVRQQVNNPAAFEIADDGAVALAAPPGPVIHAEDTRRWRDDDDARADQPQQGIAADRHRQPASQSRPRLTAKGKADLLLDVAQPHGAPGLRAYPSRA